MEGAENGFLFRLCLFCFDQTYLVSSCVFFVDFNFDRVIFFKPKFMLVLLCMFLPLNFPPSIMSVLNVWAVGKQFSLISAWHF